jgi:hypothetical protein
MHMTSSGCTTEDEAKRYEIQRNVEIIEYIFSNNFGNTSVEDKLYALTKCGFRVGPLFVYKHINGM